MDRAKGDFLLYATLNVWESLIRLYLNLKTHTPQAHTEHALDSKIYCSMLYGKSPKAT